MEPKRLIRSVGRLLDRVSDTWLFETLLGDPFTRPIQHWVDNSNAQPSKRRRVHLDADGNVLPDPEDVQGHADR